MKRIIFPILFLSLGAAHAALAQPDATTDVDATTTPEQQSPLAPSQAQTTPAKPLTLDEIIAGAAPYEPPPAPAEQVQSAAPPEPVVVVPAPAPAYTAPRPQTRTYSAPTAPAQSRQPVLVDERGATPDAPPTANDTAYEQRVLGVFHTAQGRQGALDGRWRVSADGADLYILQFSDPGAGESRIEGAWRNLRRPGGLDASGFIDQISREGDEVVVRFSDASRRSAELRLRNSDQGAWVGRVIWPEGAVNVVMTRDPGVETAALSAPAYIPPPPPPAPKAKPAPSRSKAKAKKGRPTASRSRARAKKK